MEEADLLKERLQAITDKRRIQEDIAKKRRQIEEEKLKLQYIKKKALREQWLMDGLSQQSEEEQEAMRLQAHDEQQQSDQLQSNILRIEKEIESLEEQELNISANEEAVLKRLKEVERTAEDIIKDLNAEFEADVTHHPSSPFPDFPLYIPQAQAKAHPVWEPGSDETKRATFAIEINVEHDKRTGKSQVLSTTTINSETIQERGLKIYDDGRKSVYALQSDGDKILNGVVGEMTTTEVEDLLHQATDEKVPTGVQYHQPVYSVPYTGNSRPSTPGTPKIALRQNATSFKNGSDQCIQDQEQKLPQKIHQDIPEKPKNDKNPIPQSNISAKTPQGLTNSNMDVSSPNSATPVSVTVRSEGTPAPVQPAYRALASHSSSSAKPKSGVDSNALMECLGDCNRHPPICAENIAPVNLPEEQESESITMIFMGYENAADEEEEDIQAELVIIGNGDEDDHDECVQNKSDEEKYLSYHPEGYKSQIFQPKVGIATVSSGRDIMEDTYTNWEDFELHKPTFIHKAGKHSS
ncbi:palmdelphin isoform 3-T3 [Odontesthes bonariensis]|uniref:palmdelphin isoform X3 n=1 Tax=Odontesthes bonariensis TaxID=219752 RepID=UPI003F58621E